MWRVGIFNSSTICTMSISEDFVVIRPPYILSPPSLSSSCIAIVLQYHLKLENINFNGEKTINLPKSLIDSIVILRQSVGNYCLAKVKSAQP